MLKDLIPSDEIDLKVEANKSLFTLAYHLNRVRAIGNRTKKQDTQDTIIASLKKTKTIITTTLKELNK